MEPGNMPVYFCEPMKNGCGTKKMREVFQSRRLNPANISKWMGEIPVQVSLAEESREGTASAADWKDR